MTARGGGDGWWVVPAVTLLAGVLGGSLAARFSRLEWYVEVLLVLGVAVVATGLALAVTAARGPATPYPTAEPHRTGQPQPDHRLSTPPAQSVLPALPASTDQLVRPVARPVDAPPPDEDGWWTAPSRPAAAPPRAAQQQAPGPVVAPLQTYPVGTGRIAQCPRCGGFRLDVGQSAERYHFRCRSCAHTWEWAGDRPWPAVVVRHTVRDAAPPKPEP